MRQFTNIGYNASFAQENVDVLTDFHENSHGLINQINVNIATVQKEFMKAFVHDIPVTNIDIEKAIIYTCFDEGMAHWLSLFAAECFYYENRQASKPTEHILDALRDEIPEKLVGAIRNNTEEASLIVNGFNTPNKKSIATIKHVIGIYEDAFLIQDKGARFAIQNFLFHAQAQNLLYYVKYRVGSYFANEAIFACIDAGMSVKDAILRLINNPPEKVEDLVQPDRYVRTKFLTQEE